MTQDMALKRAQSRRAAIKPGAFTLLETLGVVTLMALVAALAASGLSGATDDSRGRAAISAVREVDARARLLSASEPVELTVAEDRGALILRRGINVIIREELPAHCKAHVLANSELVASVPFTRRGTSPDYSIHIEHTGAPTTLDIAGLTGWIDIRDPHEPHEPTP